MLEWNRCEDIKDSEERLTALWELYVGVDREIFKPALPAGTEPLVDLVCKNCNQDGPHVYFGEQELDTKGNAEPLYACLNCKGTRIL